MVLFGVTFLAFLAATVTSLFVSSERREAAAKERELMSRGEEEILDRLKTLDTRIASIEEKLDLGWWTREDARVTATTATGASTAAKGSTLVLLTLAAGRVPHDPGQLGHEHLHRHRRSPFRSLFAALVWAW